MSKIDTGKIAAKIRVRITRSWRGYPVGAIISPPGAMRQILLQAKDQLGNKVAELVEEATEELEQDVLNGDRGEGDPEPTGIMNYMKKRGRPRKGESK